MDGRDGAGFGFPSLPEVVPRRFIKSISAGGELMT